MFSCRYSGNPHEWEAINHPNLCLQTNTGWGHQSSLGILNVTESIWLFPANKPPAPYWISGLPRLRPSETHITPSIPHIIKVAFGFPRQPHPIGRKLKNNHIRPLEFFQLFGNIVVFYAGMLDFIVFASQYIICRLDKRTGQRTYAKTGQY